MKWEDIPPLTQSSNYSVDVPWHYLLNHLDRYIEEYGLQLNPDFQRGHVWTEAQQVAYVEYALRDGAISGKDIYLNDPNWGSGRLGGEFVCVDGLQRLTAAVRFLKNEIPAYGLLFREFEGRMRITGPSFRFHVNNLKTRAAVLKWYLEFNSGGTPHTKAELNRVAEMLDKETTK